jgi:cohesin complex subunit SA-1/2
MEISSPEGDPALPTAAPPSTATRKSSRVIRKPQLYAPSSPIGSAKRKRATNEDDAADGADDASESDDEDESEPDEEELKERRRQARKNKSTPKKAPKKPAAKKPKTNGETVTLPLRTTASKPKKAKKAKARESSMNEADGLYGQSPALSTPRCR